MTERSAFAEADLSAVVEARATMVDVAYDSILNDILAGRHRGGDLLQENRLAEKLGLSRTPVREALGRLEGEGLLIRSGRVLTVRRISIEEFLDILRSAADRAGGRRHGVSGHGQGLAPAPAEQGRDDAGGYHAGSALGDRRRDPSRHCRGERERSPASAGPGFCVAAPGCSI